MRATLLAVVSCAVLVGAAPSQAEELTPSNFQIQVGPAILDAQGRLLNRKPAPGEPFYVYVGVGTGLITEGDRPNLTGPRSAVYAMEVASGLAVQPAEQLSWASLKEDERTTGTCLTACAIDLGSDGTRIVASRYYKFAAASPGTYTIRARIVSTNRPDPVTVDNDVSFSVVVSTAAPAALKVASTVAQPARPRSGKPFALTVGLVRGAEAVGASAVRCSATLRGKPLRGVGTRPAGRARCTWKIPAGSAGATLRAKVSAQQGGATVSVSRSYRVS